MINENKEEFNNLIKKRKILLENIIQNNILQEILDNNDDISSVNENSVEPKNVKVDDNEKKDIIKEVAKEVTKNIEKIETGWGQFWKGAYEETIKEPDASDLN